MRYIFIVAILLACNNTTPNTGEKPAASDSAGSSEISSDRCSQQYIFQKGKKVTYINYDHTGKEIARSLSEVIDVQETADGVSSTLKIESQSKDLPASYEARYSCDGANIHFDINSMFASITQQKMTIENGKMTFPLSFQVGQKLDDAGFTMVMNEKMSMETKIVDREVKALEKITTPAGTFSCYKVTANASMKINMQGSDEMEESMSMAQQALPKTSYSFWIDPNFGIVQMTIYSDEQLQSRTLLEKVE